MAVPEDAARDGERFPRPKHHLIDYGKKYPGAWKLVDEMRSGKGRGLPDWPGWCFVPVAGGISIATAFARRSQTLREQERLEMKRTPDGGAPDGEEPGDEPNLEMEAADEQEGRAALLQEILLDGPVIAALASWRPTQGIYRFDEDLLDAVWQTPLASPSPSPAKPASAGKLPTELLYRLPEWCVYVETPGRSVWESMEIAGFFAHLEWDTEKGRPELRLVIDPAGSGGRMISVPVHLGPDTLEEALRETVLEGAANAEAQGAEGADKIRGSVEQAGALVKDLAPLLSTLLYLCSANAEVRDAADFEGSRLPTNPEPKKTRKGLRLFPPDQPTVWETGYRMGAALRAAMASAQAEGRGDFSSTGAGPVGRTVRPHYRRAHWHSFWRGPRSRPEEREITVKWIPPVPVNLGDIDEDLVPVIRRVAGSRRASQRRAAEGG